MNTLPVCLMSRVMWKPQAAGWWMKYFSLTLANYAGQAWLCISYCCSRRQCHHRYTCWLLAPKESIFAESEERCLCFQVCLWCSTVRWMNGKYISTKKKKKSGSFSKARTISLILLPELRARCTSVLTTEIVVSVDQPQCWSMCFLFNYRVIYSISPSLFGTRHHFHGRQLSTDSGRGAGGDDSSSLHLLYTLFLLLLHQGFPCGSAGKRIRLQFRRPGFNLWVWKIPWRRERLPTPVFWPKELHGLYSPWSCREWHTAEQLSLSQVVIFQYGFSLS